MTQNIAHSDRCAAGRQPATEPMRVCGFCRQPLTYTKIGTLPGLYVHASTDVFFCRDENGEEHDCNVRNAPVTRWAATGRSRSGVGGVRGSVIREARRVEKPAPGVRLIRERMARRATVPHEAPRGMPLSPASDTGPTSSIGSSLAQMS